MEDSVFIISEVEARGVNTIANLNISLFRDVFVAEGLKLRTCSFANALSYTT